MRCSDGLTSSAEVPAPIVQTQSSTGTFILAPSAPVAASLRPGAGDDGHPPIPTFKLICSCPLCRSDYRR